MVTSRRKYLSSIASAAGVAMMAGCTSGDGGQGTPTEDGTETDQGGGIQEQELVIAGGVQGGANYVNGLAIQSLLNDYSDKLSARVQANNSPTQAYRRVANGDADASALSYGWHSSSLQGGFEPKSSFGEAMGMYTGYTFLLARQDAGIETIKDLDGKTVWTLQADSDIIKLAKEYNDIELTRTSPQSLSGEINRGNIDAWLSSCTYTREPGSENIPAFWQQPVEQNDVRPVKVPEDVRNWAISTEREQFPPLRRFIDIDLQAWGGDLADQSVYAWDAPSNNFIFNTESVSAKVVKEVLTIIHEHAGTWDEKKGASWDFSKAENMGRELTSPLVDEQVDAPDLDLHPGAEQFYSEQGVDISKLAIDFPQADS